MSEPIGFRAYPPGERPDVEVHVDEDRWPAEKNANTADARVAAPTVRKRNAWLALLQ